MPDEITLSAEDDAILARVWDRVGSSSIPDDLMRRMLVLSIGRDGETMNLPRSREEFDRIIATRDGSFDYDSAIEMLRRTGTKR